MFILISVELGLCCHWLLFLFILVRNFTYLGLCEVIYVFSVDFSLVVIHLVYSIENALILCILQFEQLQLVSAVVFSCRKLIVECLGLSQ